MIDGIPVIDAVVHAFNLSDAQMAHRFSFAQRENNRSYHERWNVPGMTVPAEQYFVDWPMQVLTETVFLESHTDFATNMHLRAESYYTDAMCTHAKNVEAASRWGDRYLIYVGLEPMLGLDVCLKELEEQVAELPGAVGLKLYPDAVMPHRVFRMDDPEIAFPIFERAGELGITSVAIHKAVPNGPVPLDPYRVDDVDSAAMTFPDMNFEIVHAGIAFTDETALALARFDNVYANLELTTAFLNRAPGVFEEILAKFMLWGGPEKLIWSTGANLVHPQPLLEKFWAMQFSDQTLARYHIPQLDRDIKAKILSGNYAAMHGLDLDTMLAKVADDEFSAARRENGIAPPWSRWDAWWTTHHAGT